MTISAPLIREQLDQLCDEESRQLNVEGACHPGQIVKMSYRAGSGIMHVHCVVCNKLILEVLVATSKDELMH